MSAAGTGVVGRGSGELGWFRAHVRTGGSYPLVAVRVCHRAGAGGGVLQVLDSEDPTVLRAAAYAIETARALDQQGADIVGLELDASLLGSDTGTLLALRLEFGAQSGDASVGEFARRVFATGRWQFAEPVEIRVEVVSPSVGEQPEVSTDVDEVSVFETAELEEAAAAEVAVPRRRGIRGGVLAAVLVGVGALAFGVFAVNGLGLGAGTAQGVGEVATLAPTVNALAVTEIVAVATAAPVVDVAAARATVEPTATVGVVAVGGATVEPTSGATVVNARAAVEPTATVGVVAVGGATVEPTSGATVVNARAAVEPTATVGVVAVGGATVEPTIAATLVAAPRSVEPTATAAAQLPLLDFAAGRNTGLAWPNNRQGNAWFDVDGYHLAARSPGRFVAIGMLPNQQPAGVLVTATFHKVSGPAGGGYGLIVGDDAPTSRDGTNQAGRYFVFEVGDKGEVGVWRRDQDQWLEILGWTPSTAVRAGNGENTLVVRVSGGTVGFSVNQVALSVPETAQPTAGGIGVFLGGDGNEALLSRLTVTQVD